MKKLFAKEKIWRAFLIYTIIFILLSIAIYLCFNYAGKSFVNNIDAINQHFVTLKNWRELLINFIKTGEFNTFTWQIGNGIDMFADYGYYIIGDFISYFSVLVPEKLLYYFYTAAIFVRFYLIGISFIIYAKHKKYNNFSSINGAICYTFMSYSLILAFRHPYFANAFILFPLLMLGMDKIVLENKKTFYIFMVFISFVSSFYFAYIMSLCLLIYGLILIISTYKKDGLKVIIKTLVKVFFCSLLGIIMSSFVLIPILAQFLNSNRGNSLSIFAYRYNYNYYASIARSLATFQAEQLVALGLNPIIMIALPIAIKNYKKNYKLLIFAGLLLLVTLIPFMSGIFAGFSFPTNRHVFVISLIMSLLITELLNDELKLTKKDYIIIIIFNLIYFAIAFHYGTLDKIAVFSIMCVTLLCLIFYFKKDIEKFIKKYPRLNKYFSYNLLITIILVCITANRNNLLFDENRAVDGYINSGAVTYLYNSNYGYTPSFSNLIEEISNKDKEFYKIGKTNTNALNDGLFLNYNTISYYYSIVPSILQQLPYDLSNIAYSTSMEISQFNYRTRITTLLGTKYYIMADNKDLPYGYELLKEDKSYIYQNDYSVPFATYYDKYITIDEYEKLDNIEKENELLKSIVLSKNNFQKLTHNDSYHNEVDNEIKELKYHISDDSHKIAVTRTDSDDEDKNNTFSIEIDKNQKFNGEIYLKIDNVEFKPYTRKELFNIKTKQEKYSKRDFKRTYKNYNDNTSFTMTIDYNDKEFTKVFRDNRYQSYSSGSNNVLINLGYYKDLDDLEDNTLEINLSAIGTYTYDNLEVLLVTFDDYEEDVANLNKSNYKTIEYKNGYMKGTVDLEKPGIIQFATAYVDGWDLYIDGKKSEILNVNKYFLGTYMDKGKNTIELKYHTPLIKEGTIISLVSLIIYIIVIIFDYKKNKVDLKK